MKSCILILIWKKYVQKSGMVFIFFLFLFDFSITLGSYLEKDILA